MKYTCQPTENSLDELGIPKNPYFDPSHDSVASFSRILEGGHSMPPPPIRTALICIPSVKGLMENMRQMQISNSNSRDEPLTASTSMHQMMMLQMMLKMIQQMSGIDDNVLSPPGYEDDVTDPGSIVHLILAHNPASKGTLQFGDNNQSVLNTKFQLRYRSSLCIQKLSQFVIQIQRKNMCQELKEISQIGLILVT